MKDVLTLGLPQHTRFEVEDLESRKNYTFALCKDKNQVELYNSSRGSGNPLMQTFGADGKFPYGSTAEEYYNHLYQKALSVGSTNTICFLGYVNEHFEPLEDFQLTDIEEERAAQCVNAPRDPEGETAPDEDDEDDVDEDVDLDDEDEVDEEELEQLAEEEDEEEPEQEGVDADEDEDEDDIDANKRSDQDDE